MWVVFFFQADGGKRDRSPSRGLGVVYKKQLMDVSRLAALGWRAKIALREGVEKTYVSFLAEQAAATLRG